MGRDYISMRANQRRERALARLHDALGEQGKDLSDAEAITLAMEHTAEHIENCEDVVGDLHPETAELISTSKIRLVNYPQINVNTGDSR